MSWGTDAVHGHSNIIGETLFPHNVGLGAARDPDLIEKIVAHELRHPVELDFDPQGVRCTLMVPVRERGDFEIRAARQMDKI